MPVELERLRSLPLFADLTEEELSAVSNTVEQRRVSPGARLTVEGASGYSFFVIEDGTVGVERDGRIVNTLGPGDFFGEMAIISGERRNATITATSEVDLLVLFGTAFRVLESECSSATEKIKQKMAERAVPAAQPD